MIRRVKYIVSLVLTAIIFGSIFAGLQAPAQAASGSFGLSPATGKYAVGSSFSVTVIANCGGTLVNAFNSNMSFSKDILKITGIDKTSFINMYVQDPIPYSNAAGTVSFDAGVIKGYSGSAGRVITIHFKALKAGVGKVSFAGGQLLTADGLATNIYSGGSTGTYTIEDAPKPEEPKPIPPIDQTKINDSASLLGSTTPVNTTNNSAYLPPAPEITSATHPSTDVWYARPDAKFEWKTLTSITGVSILLTDNASSTLADKSDGLMNSKEFTNLVNGVHYFYVKLQNKDGWGKANKRKFMVDNELPTTPKLAIDNGGDATNPSPLLRIQAYDYVSGISKYKLSVNGANSELKPADYYTNPWPLDKLSPGQYLVQVTAFDYAGNTSSSSINFIVDALRAPTITDAPKELIEGSDLTVRGGSFYPNATVRVFLKTGNGDPKIHDVKADDKGDWVYVHTDDRLNAGGYQIWAKIVDTRGAESVESNKHFLNVIKPDILTAYGIYIIIALIFIIILLSIYIYYIRQEFREQQLEIAEEAKEAQRRISEVFAALHEEVDELMVYADKKPGLSESERRVKEKIKEALNISEEFLSKEVDDIEKEVDSSLGKNK